MDNRNGAVELLLEGARLKEEVDLLGPRSPARRYPEGLRQRIARWVQAQRSQGTGVKQIAGQVGIPWESLSRWMETPRPKKSAVKAVRLRPVMVVESNPSKSAVVLRSPNGFRVEGLDVACLADLLRQLG